MQCDRACVTAPPCRQLHSGCGRPPKAHTCSVPSVPPDTTCKAQFAHEPARSRCPLPLPAPAARSRCPLPLPDPCSPPRSRSRSCPVHAPTSVPRPIPLTSRARSRSAALRGALGRSAGHALPGPPPASATAPCEGTNQILPAPFSPAVLSSGKGILCSGSTECGAAPVAQAQLVGCGLLRMASKKGHHAAVAVRPKHRHSAKQHRCGAKPQRWAEALDGRGPGGQGFRAFSGVVARLETHARLPCSCCTQRSSDSRHTKIVLSQLPVT